MPAPVAPCRHVRTRAPGDADDRSHELDHRGTPVDRTDVAAAACGSGWRATAWRRVVVPAAAARGVRRVRLVPDRAGPRDERPGDEPRLRARRSSASTTSRAVLADPQFGTAVAQHGLVRPAGPRVRLPGADRPRGPHERGPPAHAACTARWPTCRSSSRRSSSVLLWRFFYDASAHGVFNTVLGWVGLGPLPWLQSSGQRDAVDRHRGDVGGRRGDRDHLPRRAAQRPARAVRRGRGRRRVDLAEDPLRHAAAAARRSCS